jgi:hypothetical protein
VPKTFLRYPRLCMALGLSRAEVLASLADGSLRLTKIKRGKVSLFDEDEVLREQLNQLADARGLTGIEREQWVEAEFLRAKMLAEQMAEQRLRDQASRERETRRQKKVGSKRPALVAAE